MPVGYYERVVEELKRLGYRFLRSGKGSHEIWRGPDGQQTTVPHNLKSRHTANGILKSAKSDLRL
jgi:predicted RNA binding protein YcfA (HicA-like mRNA interferase family)